MRSVRVAVAALLIASVSDAAEAQIHADLVVHNANVVTLDARDSRARAVAVFGGRIVAVGDDATILALAGPRTDRIDAGAKTLIPGFNDSHIHMATLALNLRKVQVADLASLRQFLDRLGAAAAKTPKGAWIETASDWHESQLAEKRFPTRWELDTVTPDHPVFIRRGGHNVVVNSLALKLAGIAEDAPDPPGGHYVRDAEKRISGWILERPAIEPVARLLPLATAETADAAMRETMRILNAHGITSVRDMHVDTEGVRIWQRLWTERAMTLRVAMMLTTPPRSPAETDFARWGGLGLGGGFGDEMLRIAGIKMTHDGGVEASMLKEDFANQAGFRGIPVAPVEKIRAVSRWACANGWRMGVHTVGDAAIEGVLTVFEEVNRTCPITDKRWALEHPYLVTPAVIERMKALGIVPTTQSGHNYTLGVGWVDFWGKIRAERSIPNRTYIDAGLFPAGGTDAPVTPYDPFLALWADVTRNTRAAGVLGAREAVTPLEALKMHTVWAARATAEETIKGTIEAGKLADMVILSDDILAIAPDRIKDVKAELTILGGRVVHRR